MAVGINDGMIIYGRRVVLGTTLFSSLQEQTPTWNNLWGRRAGFFPC